MKYLEDFITVFEVRFGVDADNCKISERFFTEDELRIFILSLPSEVRFQVFVFSLAFDGKQLESQTLTEFMKFEDLSNGKCLAYYNPFLLRLLS